MKRCPGCKRELPESEFFRNRANADGLAARCKPCHTAYQRKRRSDPKVLEAKRERERRYEAEHREKINERKRNQQHATPEAQRAHWAVKRALRSGRLVRPDTCSECGSEARLQAHHDDYSKQLDVRWLCSRCHGAEHFPVAIVEGKE